MRLVCPGDEGSTVAKDLGVNNQTLRNWLRHDDLDTGRRDDRLTTAEREELFKVRRRVRVLEEEKQILLKASAFSARETDRNR